METKMLLEKVQMLPTPLKKEVENFIDFLIYKTENQSSGHFVFEEANPSYNSAENSITIDDSNPKPVFGSGKGLFGKIADDFDAPLDDMKDYM